MNKNFPTIFNDQLNSIIKNNPDIMDKWVIVISECYQYAAGICGQDFYTEIWFKDFDYEHDIAYGFDTKGEWRKMVCPKYARYAMKKKINGKPSMYGEVGAKYRIVQNVKFKDLVELHESTGKYWFIRNNRYFKNSTPTVVNVKDLPKPN